jgi:hypothetical protein
MRFMIIVRADKNTEAGVMPSEKLLTDMGKYNEELGRPAWCSAWKDCSRARRARG